MTLTVPNWDLSRCVLWDLHSDSDSSIVGSVIDMPPLDCVAGDMLSIEFEITETSSVNPVINEAWNALVTDFPEYSDIKECAFDVENEASEHYDFSNLCALSRFFTMTDSHLSHRDFRNLELFLAFCQIPEPTPKKRIVNRGFWTGRESLTAMRGYSDTIHALNEKEGEYFFHVLEVNKENLDLHCNYDIRGFADLALVSAYLTLKAGLPLIRCEHCGRLFSPGSKKEKYCSRFSLSRPDKTCKEAAKYEKQLERERSSESSRMYKSISTMLAAKCDAAKNSHTETEAVATLNEFRDKALAYRKGIKAGTKTEDEYLSWMSTYYKRRK